jgi:hypothetical protein
MKLSLVTTAALMACGAAKALTPAEIDNLRGNGLKEIYLAGSSSQRLFIAAWFQQQCKPATFDVFFNGTGSAPSGSSFRAYSCELSKKVGDFLTGTPVLLVKRDTGDSFQGVNPIALAQAQTNMLVDISCTATANSSPATSIHVPSFACPNTQNIVSHAGFSDVEPALMQRPVNLPDGQAKLTNRQLDKLDIKTVSQTIFGLAVNKKLYRALQEDQGRIPVGGVIDEDPEKRPSLKRSWVAAAFQGTAEGGGENTGWTATFNNDTADGSSVALKQVNVCRHVVGSGAQAASNAYFLRIAYEPVLTKYAPYGQSYNAKKSGSIGANQSTIQAVGTKAVQLGSGVGNVETCLGTTVQNATGFAYGLGVISRENSPTPAGQPDKNYRFVRVQSAQPTVNAAGNLGDYDFVYNATMQWNEDTIASGSAIEAFLNSLRNNAGKPASLNGADPDTQQGVMSPPSTYSGAYVDLTDPVVLKFSSRVDRLNNNSGTALRVVK